MGFFSNMNLIPKNFIVAGIVDTLKKDPEAGAQKVFDMADKFVSDEEVAGFVEEFKAAYYSQPSMRVYVKNLIYNTQTANLNHFLNNLVVKHLMDGMETRKTKSEKLNIQVPHLFILNTGTAKKAMNAAEIGRLVAEGKELGIHFLIVAGAALSNPGFLEVCEKNLDVQFLVYAKARELSPAACQRLANLPNIVPLVIVAEDEEPDVSQLKTYGILFGVAMQATSENFQKVTADGTILPFIRQGSRVSLYVTSKEKQLESEELLRLKHRVEAIRQLRPYVTLHLESERDGVGGALYFEETVKGQTFTIKVPEIGLEIGKKPLKDVFK